MERLPSTYATLEQWLPSLTARAAALCLSRETLTTWERAGLEVDVRPETARRIVLVAQVARLAARRLRTPSDAGRWLLAPQPALDGRTVAEAIRDDDAGAVGSLLASTSLPTPVSMTPAAFEEGRELPASSTAPPARRTYPRDRGKAAVLERVGVSSDMIGATR